MFTFFKGFLAIDKRLNLEICECQIGFVVIPLDAVGINASGNNSTAL